MEGEETEEQVVPKKMLSRYYIYLTNAWMSGNAADALIFLVIRRKINKLNSKPRIWERKT